MMVYILGILGYTNLQHKDKSKKHVFQSGRSYVNMSSIPSGEDNALEENYIRCKVHSTKMLTEAIKAVELIPLEGNIISWAPGSHIDVSLPNGLIRSYSLYPKKSLLSKRYSIAVSLSPRSKGGSAFIHSSLNRGDIVYISEPKNNFPFRVCNNVRFIAGGVGITSILAMVYEADKRNLEWSLDYIGESVSKLIFLKELKKFSSRVRIYTTSDGCRPEIEDMLANAKEGMSIYACGPPSLLNSIRNVCNAQGYVLHTEYYDPAYEFSELPMPEFEVTIKRNKKRFRVHEGETLADAIRRNNESISVSCRQGTCGSCEVTVIEGEIDHRDSVLVAQQPSRGCPASMMACVSRAKGSMIMIDI